MNKRKANARKRLKQQQAGVIRRDKKRLKKQILHLIRSNKKAEAGFLIERYKSRYGEINDK
jgi:hypothetical protein